MITEIVQEDSQTDTLVDRPLLDSAGSEKEQNEVTFCSFYNLYMSSSRPK